jgi:hypothetical protein
MAGYGDDDGFNAWLAENGYALPDGAPALSVLRNRGAGYVDGVYGPRFSGIPAGGFAQERAWPRTGACAYCQPIGDGIIPDAVIKASYAAAWQEATAPGSLSVSGSEASRVKREKVEGAVEVEYQASSGEFSASSLVMLLTSVEGLLAPFLVPVTTGFGILVV